MTDGLVDDVTLTNAGERMIEGNMWGYWAHLSIYYFALQFARGKRVLDVGSGSGYGAAYLARHGAHVVALEGSSIAVGHSRKRYAGDSVTFEVANLNDPLPLGDGLFDLVFSSNVFEHVANVDGLAFECARVVKPDGVVVVAVPPICSAEAMVADMENQFHVHHVPPTAWQAKLERFFTDVRCHSHGGHGRFATYDAHVSEQKLPPNQVTIREHDFDFPETTAEEMMRTGSITAVYVCRGRRMPPGPETIAERTPASWREGEAAARVVAHYVTTKEALEQLRGGSGAALAQHLQANDGSEVWATAALAARREIEALHASTSWRITAPLRAMARMTGSFRRPRA